MMAKYLIVMMGGTETIARGSLTSWRTARPLLVFQNNEYAGFDLVESIPGPTACSSSGFPYVGVMLIYWSLRSTATFVFFFHWSQLLALSLHFTSSSAVLRSLFTQSSHLSCGLPRFLEPSCFFVSALFGSLSSFIRTTCPAHFIRLFLLFCQLYKL